MTQPNDSCDNAIAIACGETLAGNTGGATAVGGDNACGGSGSGVWYTLDNGGMEQLITISTCGSTVATEFEVFQEVDAPEATLEVNSLNTDNYQNISAVIVYNGDTVATIPAGELFPTVFNDFYGLSGGDYTVYFTNEGTELDGIAAAVIATDGSAQDLLCSGSCTTDPQVCFLRSEHQCGHICWRDELDDYQQQWFCRRQRCPGFRQRDEHRDPLPPGWFLHPQRGGQLR